MQENYFDVLEDVGYIWTRPLKRGVRLLIVIMRSCDNCYCSFFICIPVFI